MTATHDEGAPLPPYSRHDAACPKCTDDDISVEHRAFRPYLVGSEVFDVSRDVSPPVDLDECLLRRCLDCGWAWLEACADAEPLDTP